MRNPERGRIAWTRDGGFSLVELIVALGVFSLLMGIIVTVTLTSFRAIREATSRSDIQTQSQNAMELASRLLRYADVPAGGTTAILDASTDGLTAYTYAGTGENSDVPTRIRLFTEATPDGRTAVVSEVVEPVRVSGAWTWTGTPQRRTLLTVPAAAGSPLTIEYFVCDPADGCSEPVAYTPPDAGPLVPAGSPLVPAYLIVSMGDASVPDTLVTQTVKLVNLS